MAKKYKAKAKGTEMDSLIKKVSAKVVPIVSERLAKIEALEKKETDAASSIITLAPKYNFDLSCLEREFERQLSCWCASKKAKLCERNNLPCKAKFCPIILRNL